MKTFKVVDTNAAADYARINDCIKGLCKIPKKYFTEEDRKLLEDLLIKRADALSRALGVKISSVVKK